MEKSEQHVVQWETPELTTFGTIEDITTQTYKQMGTVDGYVLITAQGETTIGPLGS